MPSFMTREKGKQRARDEGTGGTSGVVLSLSQAGTTVYDVSYTVNVLIGTSNPQKFSLQVDTGSSDLWIASNACSTSTCSQASGHLYNPSQSTPTGHSFVITYLSGAVSGPIVWDAFSIGGYSITNQALSAASSVSAEPLSPSFNGVLGLALPLNSLIAQAIPPVTSNNPDGAAFASNLFSITPASQAPAAQFISLSLSRPGSDRVPALLGIGMHPASLVPDPSKVSYSTLVSQAAGVLYWQSQLRAITVYVDGQPRTISLPHSASGAAFPTAILDSGVPLILTTSAIANGIYGALGIGPAADGNYYVPCTTPLNMSITLDGQPPIPLHPLDLTSPPPNDPSTQSCVGLIQAADNPLASPSSSLADVILGVPFLRNTYTVMAYSPPDAHGTFPPSANASTPLAMSQNIAPRLGLLGLTDPATALDEFHTVRVLGQPLPSASTPAAGPSSPRPEAGHGMSVGIKVLIGLAGFFGLCIALFVLRCLLARRRFARAHLYPRREKDKDASSSLDLDGCGGGEGAGKRGSVVRRGSLSDLHADGAPSEDALRSVRFEAWRAGRMVSEYTMSSGRTAVGTVCEHGVGSGGCKGGCGCGGEEEGGHFGDSERGHASDVSEVHGVAEDRRRESVESGGGGGPVHVRTLSEASAMEGGGAASVPLLAGGSPTSPTYPPALHHVQHTQHTQEQEQQDAQHTQHPQEHQDLQWRHQRGHSHSRESSAESAAGEMGMGMAGVGTLARGRHVSLGSTGMGAGLLRTSTGPRVASFHGAR